MEKIDVLLWATGGGFTAMFGLLVYILTEVRDIDRRLCRMEGAFGYLKPEIKKDSA